jgi:mono/diheme cytochrome c family protein
MSSVFSRRAFIILLMISLGTGVGAAGSDPKTPSYEGAVRRVFKTHCFQCHGEAGVVEGGLDLRLRRTVLQGGESGATIDAANPAESLLLRRVLEGEMPPEDVEHRLEPAEIELLKKWVLAGGPGADEPEGVDPSEYITPAEKAFWAFQAPVEVARPVVDSPSIQQTPVDAFLLAELQRRGLDYSRAADRRVLIRRIYFDLWGLPPTPNDVETFVADTRPMAYERLVDRLLASPRYGERWGRHWLDVAGYADSEGYTDTDAERPDAWRYRDYVIRAFNMNKPIDRFIVEQLAGDELVARPYGKLPQEELDSLIATGFLRMAPDGTATASDKPLAINDTVAKSLEIVSTSMLGLTVACAQCHDHRYDPISQKDYYRFRAIFEPAYHWKKWQAPTARRQTLYTDEDRAAAAEIEKQAKQIEADRTAKQNELIKATYEKQLAKLPDEIRETVRVAHDTADKERTPEQQALLKKHPSVNVTAGSLYLYDKKAADELKAMAEKAAEVRKTKPVEGFVRALVEPVAKEGSIPVSQLFIRGDHEQLGPEVAPAAFRVLGGPPLTPATDSVENSEPDTPPVADSVADSAADSAGEPARTTTARRLRYAQWLTSSEHPLTARVFVNRVWMHHFGRGLVDTPADFGHLGARPTHPQLLDWLALDFIDNGWDLKRLHRMIVLSTAYRQSAEANLAGANQAPDEKTSAGYEVDPENYLLWKMRVRRIEAEVLRDSVLQMSGQLVAESFGPAVPVMADRDGKFVIGKENLNAGRPGAVIPMKGQDLRRTVYIQVRRSRPLTVIDTFDSPVMTPNCTKRTASTSATQSLMLMNGDFTMQQSERLASRIIAEASSTTDSQVQLAWSLCFARAPQADELADAVQYTTEMAKALLLQDAKATEAQQRLFGVTNLCHALLSSNEFLYIE